MTTPKQLWRFEKTVSIGNLISVATAIVAIVVFLTRLETRIALLEQAAIASMEADKRQVKHVDEFRQEVRSDLADVNTKLDRLRVKGVP